MSRRSHLVGTIPAPSATEAMELALAELGPTLGTLPDGETGERLDWIQKIVESLRRHPDVELVRDGDWSDYGKTPVFRVKKGHTLRGDTLDFGYAALFRESYPIFKRLVAERGLPDIPFQVGIPGDFDLALFSMGPRAALRGRRPFTEATVREIRAIQAEAGGDVVFQIEVPAELIFVARMRGPLQRPMARYLSRGIKNLARSSPDGTRFGVHLCLGDMNHRSLMGMRDTRPVVYLANAIARGWPDGRSLEFIHAPFAAAIEPPSTEPGWYKPLEHLRVPETTRFIAGFAHDGQDLESQRQVRAIIERAVGAPVGVSASCGLGRRTPEDAVAVMRRTAELTQD